MKLARQGKGGWHYLLNKNEADSLRVLIGQFPVAPAATVKITRTDTGPQAMERERLLNESLAARRAELKREAGKLVGADRFRAASNGQLFRLSAEEREVMLQILNEIRIESWRTLGEPEELEMDTAKLPDRKVRHYHLMHLAGYFEHHFIELEGTGGWRATGDWESDK